MPPAYDLDDLDDEWKALLSELEDRLYQVHSLCHKICTVAHNLLS